MKFLPQKSLMETENVKPASANDLTFLAANYRKEVLHMNQDSMEFVVYMIHACANKWNLSPKQVYGKLQETSCIDEYLVPNYDILHTQGCGYLVDDIKEYLRIRGVEV